MPNNLISGHLDGLVLAVLVDDPAHGYAISQRLRQLSSGALAVLEGSLYPALQRLERQGKVISSWSVADGRRRRVYRLTAAGRRSVGASAREWRAFATAVDQVLGGLA